MNESVNQVVPKRGYHSSWITATVIAALLLGWIAIMTWHFNTPRQETCVTYIIFIASAACGWGAGMWLSPDSRHEAMTFSGAWKNMALLGSGYLAAKLDSMSQAILTANVLANPNLIAFRIFGAIAVFIIVAIAVYIIRVYALTVGD
jgi:hypothetical protein